MQSLNTVSPKEKQVPQDEATRKKIIISSNRLIESLKIKKFNSLEDLSPLAKKLLAENGISESCLVYAMVELNNASSRKNFSATPFNQRLLLLPHCMRNFQSCQAKENNGEILCVACGACPIADVSERAKKLGYSVIIAEDADIVAEKTLSSGAQAILGLACMDILLRMFPKMVRFGITGYALSITGPSCSGSQIDLDNLLEAMELKAEGADVMASAPMQKNSLLSFNDFMFSALKEPKDDVERISYEWIKQHGKRIRPLLMLEAYRALSNSTRIPEYVYKAALSLEIFHKASLVHDDIQDNQLYRYGAPTLYKQYQAPLAIAVGDFLVAKGYDLLTDISEDVGPEKSAQIFALFSKAYLKISQGQAKELFWRTEKCGEAISLVEVLEIYSLKTSAFFELAILAPLVFAGAPSEAENIISEYAKSFGITYQIINDIEDFAATGDNNDIKEKKPTVMFVLTMEKCPQKIKDEVSGIFKKPALTESDTEKIKSIYRDYKLIDEASSMAIQYAKHSRQILDNLKPFALRQVLEDLLSYRIERKL